MKVSQNWLKNLVEITSTPEDLSEKLSIGGFEVESLEDCSKNVNGVVITSSPGPMPFANMAKCPEVVPLFVAIAYFTPHILANSSSNLATSGPWAIIPDCMTLSTASLSSGPIWGFAIGITSLKVTSSIKNGYSKRELCLKT